MKIIFVIASMRGGGSERVVAALAEQFALWRHSVTILMTSSDEVAYTLNPCIEVRQIDQKSGGGLGKRMKRIRKLRKEISKDKNCFVISFGTETNLFCILAGLGKGISMVLSERSDPNQCTFLRLRNMIYAFGNHFVFQTDEAKSCFSKSVQARSHVIPNPIMGDLSIRRAGDRDKLVVAVGRLSAPKNHRMLLDAFAKFHQTHLEYDLVIYGEGELRQSLEKYISELGIAEDVTLAGFQQNIHELIINATMYVLSSDYEGISNSLLEAMALGLPVISTDCPIGGSRMCIENGINGILTPVGDAVALASAMCQIADDPIKAEEMGQEARKVRETFSVEKIAAQWLDFGVKK